MSDNGNKVSPVRTLTVKNFSVIKEAKLDFGKITVLIGPQASGKSLLCNLAYFLGSEVLEIATQSVLDLYQFEDFLTLLKSRFVQRFTVYGGRGGGAAVDFTSGKYSVRATWTNLPMSEDAEFEFSNDFRTLYRT